MVVYENIEILNCRIEKEDLYKDANIKCSFRKTDNWVNHVKENLDDVEINGDVKDLQFKGWFSKPNLIVQFNTPAICETISEIHRHDGKEHFTLKCNQEWMLYSLSSDDLLKEEKEV